MKFSAATVLAVATGALAGYPAGNVTYVTEVVTDYTTYCPEPTTLTYGDVTYTITEPTTLTITDCPCTISKPVITTSTTECYDCPKPTEPPVEPTYVPPPPPPAQNSTLIPSHVPTGVEEPSEVPTAGAGKAAALSLAGLLGFAALAL